LHINEDAKLRQAAYRVLFTHHVEATLIDDIRKATKKIKGVRAVLKKIKGVSKRGQSRFK
jgi:hypothetical protein